MDALYEIVGETFAGMMEEEYFKGKGLTSTNGKVYHSYSEMYEDYVPEKAESIMEELVKELREIVEKT